MSDDEEKELSKADKKKELKEKKREEKKKKEEERDEWEKKEDKHKEEKEVRKKEGVSRKQQKAEETQVVKKVPVGTEGKVKKSKPPPATTAFKAWTQAKFPNKKISQEEHEKFFNEWKELPRRSKKEI